MKGADGEMGVESKRWRHCRGRGGRLVPFNDKLPRVLRKIGAPDRILSGKLDSCVPNCRLYNIYCIVQSFNTVSLLLNCALPFYTFQKRIIIIVLLASLLLQLCCNSEL